MPSKVELDVYGDGGNEVIVGRVQIWHRFAWPSQSGLESPVRWIGLSARLRSLPVTEHVPGCITGISDGLELRMTAAPEMRDLAYRLLAYEADPGVGSAPMGSPTLRVYEKLRHSLIEFVGISGFQSLATRALTLTRAEAASLDGVWIAENGSLEGLIEIHPQSEMEVEREGDVGILLIARLLGLLRVFLGEALTIRLLRNAWPSEAFDDGNAVNGRKA